MTLASRIGVMNQGASCRSARRTRSTSFPNTRFVAEFIGNVNMFEGRIVEDEPDHVLIDSPELGGNIYVGHGVSTAPEATVWTAVRPEKMQLTSRAACRPSTTVLRRHQRDRLHGRHVDLSWCSSIPARRCASRSRTRMRHAEDRLTWDERVWISWHESSWRGRHRIASPIAPPMAKQSYVTLGERLMLGIDQSVVQRAAFAALSLVERHAAALRPDAAARSSSPCHGSGCCCSSSSPSSSS